MMPHAGSAAVGKMSAPASPVRRNANSLHKRVDLSALEQEDSRVSLTGKLMLSASNQKARTNLSMGGGLKPGAGLAKKAKLAAATQEIVPSAGLKAPAPKPLAPAPAGQTVLLPAGMQKASAAPVHSNGALAPARSSAATAQPPWNDQVEVEKRPEDNETNLVPNHTAGLSDARNPLKVLQRLRQDPDSTEFVYLRPYRVNELMPINPYHLEIVPHAEIDEANFFTLSSFGVTHFVNGKPEFAELEQWKREHYLFNAIVKIPVFRQYRSWKTYKVWRDSVRYGKMKKCAKALQKDLFCLNPTFQEALLKIRAMCMDMKKIKLLNFEPGVLYTLENFFHSQQAQRSNIIGQLQHFWVSVIDVARNACIHTLESLEEGLFGKMEGLEVADGKDGGADARMDSFRYTVMASKRVVQRRLFYFLRLADYIIFSSLHEMVVESVVELLDNLYKASRDAAEEKRKQEEAELSIKNGTGPKPEDDEKEKKKKKVSDEKQARKTIFMTEVMLVLGDLNFVPSADDFENELESIVGGFVDTVAGDETRLLNHEELEQYTELYDSEADASEAASVSDIITNDEQYLQLVSGLRDAVADAFSGCNVYLETFESYREMVLNNEQMNAEELYENAEKGEVVLDDFAGKLETFNGQAHSINEIPDIKEVGIMEVNAERFKEMIAPSPAACLDKINAMLPQLAILKQQKLLDEVGAANNKLNHKPTEVAEFVSILDFINECNERKDDLEKDFKELVDHYALMDKHNVKVNSMDRAGYKMLVPEFEAMKNIMELLDSTKDEEMAKWGTKLEEDIKVFHESVSQLKGLAQDERLLEDVEFIDPVMSIVQGLKDDVTKLENTAKANQQFQTIFGQQLERYPELEDVASDINLKLQMWEARSDIFSLTDQWKETLVMEMPLKEWEAQCTKWYKTAGRAERELPANSLVPKLKEQATIWKNLVPACGDLKNPNLQDRHWEKLEGLVGFKFERDPETWSEPFTLGALMKKNIMQFKDDIQRISTEATQESVLEEMLGKVKAVWAEAEFVLNGFKDQKDVYILAGVDDVQANLDESMMTVGTILASRYVAGIRTEVEKMESSLKSVQAVLDEWLGVQKNWMYLEPIFSAPDIQRQLPAEAKMFADVDKGLKLFLKKVSENPNCMRVGLLPGQADIFSSWNATLETTQKQLEAYLEFKCMAFPRFYFLSNDELLEILAQTRNVQAVQPHINKCFDGIKSLDFGGQHANSPMKNFDENSVDIFGIISPESEYVTMGKNLKARGEVENWLMATERRMVESLRQLSKESVVDYTTRPRHEWVMDHAGQIVILVSHIYWVKGAEEALDGLLVPDDPIEGIKKWYDQTVVYLNGLITLVRGELTKLQRGSLVALITIDVHNRDIIEYLVNDSTTSKNDFNWQMRIRYYWDDSIGAIGDCRIQQVTAEFVFAHEYLGASFRLVITPLSDRCYMTLTGALQLQLGGAPAGPAGTGKTETTKDLAKALGNCCVVFNCGDNLDYKFMGKFFKGLAQCGAWACFDEFNRIDVEVLSVVAQQIITIQIALRGKVSEFEFEGQVIKLLLTFGVFITMNPGYAGRTELPDNLKALFRPMSMMVPDYALIAEISLFAEGFETAKVLSKKMAKLYKLASEQVSAQPHYDFGMRAIKSVLVMAGTGKRQNPDMSETIVMIRAMCDSNIPKFLDDDVVLFNAIVQDLFPGTEVPKQDSGALVVAIKECLEAQDLRETDAWVDKCVQLYEVLGIRFGVMQVGPSGGGKTTMARCIAEAMGKLREGGSPDVEHQVTHTYCLNPKSISMGELYGNYNLLTNEWTDGLGSTVIRNANSDTTDDKKFIVFDGPIDAIWIENMNTVLDDNRTLCLPNGERIKLNGKTMRMLFEVEECSQASPATVSRLGVVWLPPEALTLKNPVHTWIAKYTPEGMSRELKDHFLDLYDQTVEKSIKFVRRNCKELIPTMDNNLVFSCCRLFQSLFVESKGAKLDAADILQTMTKIFMFSLIWSVGGNVDGVDGKEKFSEFVREEFGNIFRFPNSNTVYDYVLDPETKDFQPWEAITRAFVYDKTSKFSDILVPTKDTCRYSFILGACTEVFRNFALIGDTGTGKSVIVADAFNFYMDKLNLVTLTMNCSAQTGAKQLQEAMELKFEKRRKGVIGSPIGKILACFIDDVNMPTRETYGAQPPIEVLRLMQDKVEYYRPNGGCWDRKKLFWNELVDTVLVTACGPPGGGRNIVTNRYFRFFNMLNISPPSQGVLKVIFGSILDGHLNDFPNDVKMLSKQTVDASIEVYERISAEMLPTPAKSHYTFNLRDLSKVFQGVLSLRVQHCPDARTYCRLWTHECQRVFADRLIDLTDKNTFNEWLHEYLKRKFSMDWDFEEIFKLKPILFGDYLKMGVTGDDRVYEPIQDNSKLPKLMDAYLEDYNASSPKTMNLVFFMDAIEHISRLARIIRSPRGNAMLVGLGGSGKQSLTRLSAFMAEFTCFQIELSKGYSNNEFREDLKKIFILAGVERQTVVFLFTDGQIVNEGFVEDINSILNAGDVPNLFAADEKDRVIGDCREYTASLGKPLTKDGIYSTFIACVQANLHCVLCMSPIGEAFRRRCRMFPSLINCCTIDWYLPWPQEALADVAERFMAQVENVSDDHKAILAKMCPIIHGSVERWSDKFFEELRRKFYISPKSYLDMIALYTTVLKDKRMEMSAAKDRFVNGLSKMEEVTVVIDSAKQDLAELEPVLKEKSAATEVLLKQVAIDKEEAAKVEVVVSKEAAEVEEFAKGVKVIQEDAQRDLDEALPALNAAVSALNSLTKGDITEVKSFAKPPPLVQTTMEAVCTLLGRKPDWDNSKKLLGEADFMEQLLNFDKDNIDPKRIKGLQKYIAMEDFTAETVGRVSKAAKGLCMWARAMDVYARVAKEVEPKKAKLAEANSQLDTAMTTLNAKKANLKEVQDKVAVLQQQLDGALAEQKSLSDQADLCQARLDRSGKLTSALGDEQVNWTRESEILTVKLEQLVGNVFLGSACVAYIGPFTGLYRKQIMAEWVETSKELGLPTADIFDLPGTLAKAVDIRSWNIQGLPSDEVSIGNGVLVKNTSRWPLMIDPEMQANKWVKQMEEQNGLRLIKLSDGKYLQTIEACVRNGNPLLLEDVGEELDPALEPILMKQLFKQGGRLLIRLGENDIDYDENFRFYMTTKLPNPHYLPDVCIKSTIINFMITMDGLEDQLLGDVVRQERPDLEEKKDKLVVQMANDMKQLGDLQDKVLKLLKEAEGMILDNEPLINTLQQSKVTSGMINKRVAEAEEANISIAEAREGYRTAATRGALLYFVIADLPSMDPMYQYSLEYFKKLYNYCIETSEKAEDLQIRLDIIMNFVTKFMYLNVCRGLFERHKLIYSFLIYSSIFRNRNEISGPEWNSLLRGGFGKPGKNPDPSFIPQVSWESLAGVQESMPDIFPDLCDHISNKTKEWKSWAATENPQTAPMPSPWNDTLNSFQKMCILKIFRREKLVFATENIVAEKLGKAFTESPPIVLAEIYPDTSPTTPIIFVLSTGSDPTGALIKFAEDRGVLNKFQSISLGQGQGPVAEKLCAASTKVGNWVCLMNCHLATSWMKAMERMVDNLSLVPPEDSDFRLWLTSQPSKAFPVSVLQNGIKLTNEPPRGMRANLIGTFTTLGEDEWECMGDEDRNARYWKKMVPALAFFHGVTQERRKYGPLGWNIRYEFNTSDVLCAKDVLKMFVRNFGELPWTAITYITGHVNYGGRVTDDQDRRCLMTILSTYYPGEEVVQDENYKFSESGTYYSPPVGSFQDLMKYFDNLPSVDNPEVFGMHDNANIAYQLQETSMIYDTVLSLQPKVGGAVLEGQKSPEEIVDDFAGNLEEQMPDVLDREKAHESMFHPTANGAFRSLDTVLVQEMDRFNRLIRTMKTTIKDLRKAIKGIVVMSADLEEMFTSFQNNTTPGLWTKVAYPCLKPLASWFRDYTRRVDFFRSWCEKGQPKSFWLPGFYYPQGFMTGALQTHARRYTLPIDQLNFSFVIKNVEGAEDVADAPEDGVYISGLYLEAGRWDRRAKKLKPSNPGEMMSLMPIIHFNPVIDYVPEPADYQSPLYKTNLRAGVLNTTGQSTNYILDVSIPTDEKPSHWVLMATAMVCMTND